MNSLENASSDRSSVVVKAPRYVIDGGVIADWLRFRIENPECAELNALEVLKSLSTER
jgi:hypothetical protein